MNKLDLLKEKPVARKFTIVIIVILTITLVAVVFITGSQQPDSSTQDSSVEFLIATEALGSGEDIVISIDDVTLYVPGGVITQGGSISLYKRRSVMFYEEEELTWHRPFVVSIEYRNENGAFYPQERFSSPVEICFKLSPTRWEDYINYPENFQVQYLVVEDGSPHWEALPIVSYAGRNELCGQIDYFPLFSLAMKVPESGGPFVEAGVTPTPRPATVLDFLFDIFRENPTETPVGSGGVDEPSRRPDDVYEP